MSDMHSEGDDDLIADDGSATDPLFTETLYQLLLRTVGRLLPDALPLELAFAGLLLTCWGVVDILKTSLPVIANVQYGANPLTMSLLVYFAFSVVLFIAGLAILRSAARSVTLTLAAGQRKNSITRKCSSMSGSHLLITKIGY